MVEQKADFLLEPGLAGQLDDFRNGALPQDILAAVDHRRGRLGLFELDLGGRPDRFEKRVFLFRRGLGLDRGRRRLHAFLFRLLHLSRFGLFGRSHCAFPLPLMLRRGARDNLFLDPHQYLVEDGRPRRAHLSFHVILLGLIEKRHGRRQLLGQGFLFFSARLSGFEPFEIFPDLKRRGESSPYGRRAVGIPPETFPHLVPEKPARAAGDALEQQLGLILSRELQDRRFIEVGILQGGRPYRLVLVLHQASNLSRVEGGFGLLDPALPVGLGFPDLLLFFLFLSQDFFP
jgi:hypothetical protein